MPPIAATLVCCAFCLGLFWLDRDPKARTSASLWVTFIWVFLASTRSFSQWFQIDDTMRSSVQLTEGSPIDRFIYSGLVVVAIAVLLRRRRQTGRLLRGNAPILIFFLYCLVSLGWADYPDIGFKRWIKAVGDFTMVLIVLSEVDPWSAMKKLFARLSFVLMPFSVLLIKYYPAYGREYSRWTGEVRYTGVTTNKNALGAICLCCGVICLWRLLRAYRDRKAGGRNRQLIANGVVLSMILWLFWITNSMTSWVCFLMAGVILVVASSRLARRRPEFVLLLLAGQIFVSATVVFVGIATVLHALGRSLELTDRTGIWAQVIRLTPHALVGSGFENFWLGSRLQMMWAAYAWHPGQSHNGYIEVYANLGWLGVSLLAMVLVTGYRNAFAAWRRNPGLGNINLAFFLVGIVYNFSEAAFFRMMTPTWIFFLFAITWAQKPKPSAQPWLEQPVKTQRLLEWQPTPWIAAEIAKQSDF
ncbi:MAG TPA: hypothetical protein VKW06_11955 [Candidatus Angelobacter sp.]|nr:hypothetical protein [Candidatus Angelobacter sp.]